MKEEYDDPLTCEPHPDVGCSVAAETARRVYPGLRCPPGEYTVGRCKGANCSRPEKAVIFNVFRGMCWACYAETIRKPAGTEAAHQRRDYEKARKAVLRRCDRVGGTLLCDLPPADDDEEECGLIAAEPCH